MRARARAGVRAHHIGLNAGAVEAFGELKDDGFHPSDIWRIELGELQNLQGYCQNSRNRCYALDALGAASRLAKAMVAAVFWATALGRQSIRSRNG